MSEFKIKLKLTGLEVEVSGSQEDLPRLTSGVSDQLAGLLAPSAGIVDAEFSPSQQTVTPIVAAEAAERARSTRKRAKRTPRTVNEADNTPKWVSIAQAPARFGTPMQGWSLREKSIWLLFVVQETTDVKEMTATQIEQTFNHYFRQAGTIRSSNVSRDLGRVKLAHKGELPLVVENTHTSPATWSLTDSGISKAKELVALSLGKA